jgi:hypothetical protein
MPTAAQGTPAAASIAPGRPLTADRPIQPASRPAIAADGASSIARFNGFALGLLRTEHDTKMLAARMLIAAGLSSMAAACTTVQVDVSRADKAGEAARVLRTRIDFVDSSDRVIPYTIIEQKPDERATYKHVSFPDPIEVNFYSVSGRLAGSEIDRFFRVRLKRTHAWIESGTQADFALSLAAIEEMIRARAAAYVPKPEDKDFNVAPADARFARLIVSAGSPFLYPYDEREAGFIDRTTGDHYALLYVDRPCRITGTIRANDGAFRHDLSFGKAGLQWVRIQPVGEADSLVTRLDPAGAVVVYVRHARR